MDSIFARVVAAAIGAVAIGGFAILTHSAVQSSNQAAATATRFVASMPIPAALAPAK
ncbi:MAG: hypothetical protein KGJ74_07155 [Betaproteobacteria bacterium]|nr:hypothetical protein [Betaproteobacteria bacterium]